MSNDLYDDVAAPHFEERLWHELATTHAAVRAGSYTPREPRHPRQRRTRRRFLAATAAIASVAAAVTAVVVIRDDGEGGGDGTRTGTPREAEASGTDLASQISEAQQAAAADSIVHIYQDARGEPQYNYDTESWYDETTGWRRDLMYDLDGQPSYDTGAAQAPSLDESPPLPIPPDASPLDPSLPTRRIRTVDHCFSEYADSDQTALPGSNQAEDVGRWLAEGTLIEDGTEVVGGRELIRLVQTLGSITPEDRPGGWDEEAQTETPESVDDSETTVTVMPSEEAEDAQSAEDAREAAAVDSGDPDEILMIYFVDPETYRPVMHVGYPGTQPDYSDATYVMTYEYLPRTAESMANLVAPIPDGFQQVPQLHSDGERADAGC